MSSDEELVIAEAGEEFVTVEAFEHSGEELADSRVVVLSLTVEWGGRYGEARS